MIVLSVMLLCEGNRGRYKQLYAQLYTAKSIQGQCFITLEEHTEKPLGFNSVLCHHDS